MKFYKDANNQVYAYESDGSQDAFIKPGLIAITQAEADVLRTPPPQVPTKVQMAQARLALLQQGYLDQVNSILSGLTGDAGKAAQIEWNYRQYVGRNNHLVQAIKTQLPLTEQQLDDLFTLASTL